MLFKSLASAISFSLLLLLTPSVHALSDIQVVALFTGKAVVMLDGQKRILSVGQTSPEGVTLVAADSNRAVLQIDGKQRSFPLGQRIGANYSTPSGGKTVKIYKNSGGMFTTPGSINGQAVSFLVDTGASSVAMNSGHAKRLGIRYKYEGRKIGIGTASGTTSGYRVTLERVKVGSVELTDVEGVVIEGSAPPTILLGMTFLGQLSVKNEGSVMELERKY